MTSHNQCIAEEEKMEIDYDYVEYVRETNGTELRDEEVNAIIAVESNGDVMAEFEADRVIGELGNLEEFLREMSTVQFPVKPWEQSAVMDQLFSAKDVYIPKGSKSLRFMSMARCGYYSGRLYGSEDSQFVPMTVTNESGGALFIESAGIVARGEAYQYYRRLALLCRCPLPMRMIVCDPTSDRIDVLLRLHLTPKEMDLFSKLLQGLLFYLQTRFSPMMLPGYFEYKNCRQKMIYFNPSGTTIDGSEWSMKMLVDYVNELNEKCQRKGK